MRFGKLGAGLAIFSLVGAFAHAAPIPNMSQGKKQALGSALPEGEKALYIRVVDSFRRGQIKEVYKYRDLLLKNYPRSIYGDNALYLAGTLDYQRGRVAEAVRNFAELERRYPQGNKRAAALYGKGMAYAKLNLPQLSRQVLLEITEKFPGSPESQRAWIDLRLKGHKG